MKNFGVDNTDTWWIFFIIIMKNDKNIRRCMKTQNQKEYRVF